MTFTDDLIARGLAGLDAELGASSETTYHVYIRAANYERIAELTDWRSFSFTTIFNDVGTWALETSSDSIEGRLLSKQGGIIVTREIGGVAETIFSGFVWTEWAWTATTFRAAGYSDEALFWTPARPTPSQEGPPFQDAYHVHTGNAQSVMHELVLFNIGAGAPPLWRHTNLTFAPNSFLGTTITSRANLQPLLTLLAELAITPYAGGLGFYLRQADGSANNIEFGVYAPPDRSADCKFSIDLGTIAEYEDTSEAPGANHVYVMGGDGFGTNRTTIVAKDDDSIAEWGRVISTVIDRRGTTDTGELQQNAAEAIAGVVTLRRTAVVPFDVPSLQYGVDYDLGTLVTVVTHGGEVVDLIRQVEVNLDPERGPIITPIVGQGDGSDEERSATMVRTIQGRISNLERNWNVPPNSIDRSMMVPVMKPPIGAIWWIAGPALPAGYLLCNGQAVSRSTYSLLFATIATIWGSGDGGSTFNVPNLLDRSPIGAGATYGLAQLMGATTGTVAAHDHTGAPHTHPGSHSHGTVSHSHTQASHSHSGAAHTHPGVHGHDLSTHDHNFDHAHSLTVNPFSSGGVNIDTVAVGHGALGTGTTDHHHVVTMATVLTDGPDHLDTSQGFTIAGNVPLVRTGNDSDAGGFGASYSGSGGTAAPSISSESPSTESDSNVFGASYTGHTGSVAATSVNVVHPSAALYPIIYAGV